MRQRNPWSESNVVPLPAKRGRRYLHKRGIWLAALGLCLVLGAAIGWMLPVSGLPMLVDRNEVVPIYRPDPAPKRRENSPVPLPPAGGSQQAAVSTMQVAPPSMRLCAAGLTDCVVDGDTFRLAGETVRIADIDTPEIHPPRCAAEAELGFRARDRLLELLNAGGFELAHIPDRDRDKHGRQLRIVLRDGRSVGDALVAEGLARTWTGRREPWC